MWFSSLSDCPHVTFQIGLEKRRNKEAVCHTISNFTRVRSSCTAQHFHGYRQLEELPKPNLPESTKTRCRAENSNSHEKWYKKKYIRLARPLLPWTGQPLPVTHLHNEAGKIHNPPKAAPTRPTLLRSWSQCSGRIWKSLERNEKSTGNSWSNAGFMGISLVFKGFDHWIMMNYVQSQARMFCLHWTTFLMRIKPTEIRRRQGQASDRSLTPTSDEFQVVLHLRCKSGGNQDIVLVKNKDSFKSRWSCDLYVFKSFPDISMATALPVQTHLPHHTSDISVDLLFRLLNIERWCLQLRV